MRDNTRRLNPAAYKKQSSRAAPSSQVSDVPVPSFFVELPSRGIYYPQDHALHNKETIEIKEMTAKEEEILSSQELIKEKVAIDRFLDSVVVNLDISPQSLLLADRDAIVYESRARSYGNKLHLLSYECPACQAKQKTTTKTTVKIQQEDLSEYEDICFVNEDGKIEFTFSNGMNLQCNPVDINLESKIIKQIQENPAESFINVILRTTVVSYGDITDKKELKTALETIPARDSKKFRDTYQKMLPQYRAWTKITCKECDHDTESEVPLGAEWFWLVD